MRIAFLIPLLLAGASCGRQEEVRRYKAPKDPMWRMIGAIVPSKDGTWFFKVVGPADRVGSHKDEVLSFVRALRSEDGEIKWTMPRTWKEDHAGGPGRQACLHFGEQDPKLEMTVVRLPGDGGGLVANVNRWLEQLGLERATDAQVAGLVKKVAATNVEAQVVDLIGPTRPSGGPRMMSKPPEPTSSQQQSPIVYDLPAGWTENPNPSEGRRMEFHVDDAAGRALVTLTALSNEGGGLAPNIDRWRGQAGLEPLGEQGIARSATPMRFLGFQAHLVEAIGKDRAILGVIAISSEASLFLKMDGQPNVVTSQRSNFVRFAESFQMRRRDE
jgi:hypothetical protein